jgi:hypothetical protein
VTEHGVPPGSGPEPSPTERRGLWDRLYGALTLDAAVFDEVEHDPDAMWQAVGVVALGGVAEAIGFPVGLGALPSGFIGWLVSAAVIWIIGVKILEHTSDFPELLRTLGFASAPKVLLVFGAILGPLSTLLWLFVLFLVAVAFIVAVRQALDVPTSRALSICVAAAVLNLIPSLFIGGAAWLI